MSELLNIWPEQPPYATGSAAADIPTLTPYPVQSGAPTGAVIVCPGGGYGGLADHEGEPIARWLNGIGIAAFVLRYRVAPYKHPAPLLDAQRAIRYVRHHAGKWNVDAGHIGILGFSAGGHLVSTTATHYDLGIENDPDPVQRESCRPDAVIPCYPVTSFGEYRHQGSLDNLLGPSPDPELQRSLSNELQVTADTPPAFIWHTADDAPVPAENSLLFAQALAKHKVPYELHIYESGPHGMGLGEQDESVGTWTKLCGLWLKKRGF